MTTASAPIGIGAPVKMRTASPARDLTFPIDARYLLANYTQNVSQAAFARNHRVTIHRGVIKQRHWKARENVSCRKTTESVREWRHARWQDGHTIENFRERLFLRDHRFRFG